jgi:hypothetical protein
MMKREDVQLVREIVREEIARTLEEVRVASEAEVAKETEPGKTGKKK